MGVLHTITIASEYAPEYCSPTPETVKNGDTVKWTSSEFSDWRVAFGPTAPVNPKVLSPTQSEATVTAKRPGDFIRHKYVVVMLSGTALASADPELIVEENGP